jgi:hypothetical protein
VYGADTQESMDKRTLLLIKQAGFREIQVLISVLRYIDILAGITTSRRRKAYENAEGSH